MGLTLTPQKPILLHHLRFSVTGRIQFAKTKKVNNKNKSSTFPIGPRPKEWSPEKERDHVLVIFGARLISSWADQIRLFKIMWHGPRPY